MSGAIPELCTLSLAAMSEGLQRRDFSATMLLEAHLEWIAAQNPSLNAIVTLDAARAREEAQQADRASVRAGSLAGIPITLKDSLETKGMRTTCGSPRLERHIPDADGTVVRRLRETGAIILGKTNLPPGCRGMQTDNPLFGRTLNPWNPERTPGGSSGGAACAVASGMVPLDFGSDLGGSLRIPAHYCGVSTLMATSHRISRIGHIPEFPGKLRGLRSMGVIGPIARTIEDLETVFRIIAGPDPMWPILPPVPLGERVDQTLTGMRIAWVDAFPGLSISPSYHAVYHAFLKQLEAGGVILEEGLPEGFDVEAGWEAFGFLRGAETASSLTLDETESVLAGMAISRDADNLIDRAHYRGAFSDMRGYTECLSRRDALIQSLEARLETVDALLCPVTAVPAFPHQEHGGTLELEDRSWNYVLAAGNGFTVPFSLTGSPVVTQPIGCTAEGLPVGIQVIGSRWKEMKLLAIARALETVSGGFSFPPVPAS